MGWVGYLQTPDINRAVEVAITEMIRLKQVQIKPVHFFGEKTKEHPYEWEYEVYVYEED